MTEWIMALNAFEKIFLACAILGGALFAVRLVMMFIGGDSDGDADAGGSDVDAGGDVHDGDAHHDVVDSDVAFKLLSFQGITAFFMMFGLVGLAMSRGSGLHYAVSLLGAIAAGSATVWLTDRIFRSFGKLQSSGTLNLKNAVGQNATVYLTIKAESPGKVQVVVQGRLKTLDAVSNDKTEIKTDAKVKVVGVQANDVLVVERA
jgi:membrane protein implicated in regulation of membrane protease activity